MKLVKCTVLFITLLLLNTTLSAQKGHEIICATPKISSARDNNFTAKIASGAAGYGNGFWRLIVTDIPTTCRRQSEGLEFLIHSIPTITVRDSITVCSGQSATISASDSLSTGRLLNFVWYRDAALTDTVSLSASFTINNIQGDSTFYVVAKDSSYHSVVKTTTVQLASVPEPPVAYTNRICDGTPASLLTTANCFQQQWHGPSGSITGAVVLPSNPDYLDGTSWYLECKDSSGCLAVSNTVILQIDTLPVGSIDSLTARVCAGDSVFAIAKVTTSTSALQYLWYNEANLIGIGTSLSLSNVNQGFNLYLVTRDSATGCNSTDSTVVFVNAPPAAPIITGAMNPYCVGDTLRLSTTTNAAKYLWTGTNGALGANAQYQRILTLADAGFYYLSIVDTFGCTSELSSVSVNIRPLPALATVYSNGGVCAGQDAQFWAKGGSQGAIYHWYQLPADTLVGMGSPFDLLNVEARDSTNYYVKANLNGCSRRLDTVFLPVYPTKVLAQAGADLLLCGTDTALLTAQSIPTRTTGMWTSGSNIVIQQPNKSTTTTEPLPVGQHFFYWTLFNPICSNYSTDTLLVEVLPALSEQANAGADQQQCEGTGVNLKATAPQIGVGCWSQTSAQSSAGIIIVDTLDPNTAIRGLQTGQQYAFVWQLKNGRCGAYSLDTVIITIENIPNVVADAMGNIMPCLDDSILVQAIAAPSGQVGTWTSLNGGVVLSPNQAISSVINLPLGSHAFVWSLSTTTCLNYSSDTTIVTVIWPQPIAQPDVVELSSNTSTINVISNDKLTDSWIINLQQTLSQGQLINLNTGEFTVTLDAASQQESFIYQLCDGFCVNSCDTATVLVSADRLLDCPIPNIFTPNNDGVNDLFKIPCVSEQYPTRLEVFNRWGDRVYQSDNYLNQWDGSHGGAVLPDGTYFYVLQLSGGIRSQGSVEIRR